MKLRELFEAKKLPNENSLGQPIAHTEEALKNFWNWFNGSKVVDSQGRPLVVYHGTNKKFKKINLKKGAQSIFWFTSDKSAVESGNVGAAGHGVIMELYVNIKNPANWKQYDQLMLDELKSRGFDGALLPDSDGSMTGFILNSHAQVKAVSGNKGTYSGNSIVDETLFEARSLPNENSLGIPITNNPQSLKNFWAWFKGSKVVDANKRPLVMYHGTMADFPSFSYEFADTGVGAYGMGFYFTTMPHTASGYAAPKSSDQENIGGNVIPSYLNIKKPMDSGYKRLLNRMKVKEMILMAPNLDMNLANFGDVGYEGKDKVLNNAIEGYCDYGDTQLRQLNSIANDFYSGDSEAFLKACIAITEFDGVVHKYEKETFFVAWDPSQIKSAVGNTGNYGAGGMVDETLNEELENGEDRIEIPGGLIRIVSPAPYSPRDASVVEFIVDENKRNQGIGSKLVHMAVNKYPDLGAQVSSIASMKAFYNNRFRNPKIPDGSFDDHIEAFNENWGSLFMASTDKEGNRY